MVRAELQLELQVKSQRVAGSNPTLYISLDKVHLPYNVLACRFCEGDMVKERESDREKGEIRKRTGR